MMLILRSLGDRSNKYLAEARGRKWAGEKFEGQRKLMRTEALQCRNLAAHLDRADLWVTHG